MNWFLYEKDLGYKRANILLTLKQEFSATKKWNFDNVDTIRTY